MGKAGLRAQTAARQQGAVSPLLRQRIRTFNLAFISESTINEH